MYCVILHRITFIQTHCAAIHEIDLTWHQCKRNVPNLIPTSVRPLTSMGDTSQIPKSDMESGTLPHFCWMPLVCWSGMDPVYYCLWSVAPKRIWKWGRGTCPAQSDGKKILVVPLYFLALKVQLVVLVSAFVMVSAIWSVFLLSVLLTAPPCPICKSWGHLSPVPHGGGATFCGTILGTLRHSGVHGATSSSATAEHAQVKLKIQFICFSFFAIK